MYIRNTFDRAIKETILELVFKLSTPLIENFLLTVLTLYAKFLSLTLT